jgi:hypothetical protein
MDENNIPKHIWELMHSMKTSDINLSIEEEYGFKPEQTHQLAILENKIFSKELTINDFPGAIKTTLNLNENTANSIAFDVCEGLFVSAEPYLIGVKQLMARLKPEQVNPENSNIVNLKNK